MVSVLEEILEAVVKAESEAKVKELTQKAVDEGYPVREILDNGLVKGINVIGQMWKEGEAFIPEVLISAKVMRAGTEVIKELMAKSGIKPIGKVVIGTVKGDVHSIGKSLVAMMMENVGFEVHDLGVDITPEKFVEAVKTQKADLLAMSALLTTTMRAMADTIQAVNSEELKITTIIGGAPTSQEYADSIGADGYAADAQSAVDKAKVLLGM
jgi:5-methyltetrahydrofolate--homocysteine methyltransferase